MISILLPVYNAAGTVERSIRSLLGQTVREFELLVLDDGSTDRTEEIVRRFSDERVQYHRLPHGGIAAALNEGIRRSRFDVLARMDAGDIAFPDRLERQYRALMQRPEHSIVSCHYAVFRNRSVEYLVEGETGPDGIRRRLALHPDIPHQGVMYRKQFITAAGMYRPVPLEDYDLWLRVKDSAEFILLPEVLMLVEHTRSSLTNLDVRSRYRDHYALQHPYYPDLTSFGITDQEETMMTIGWREYFYGTRSEALRAWRRIGFRLAVHPRILTALLVMLLLPERAFITFKEQRMRQRLSYLMRYFSAASTRCRAQLRHSLSAEGQG
ncbi:MAG: glycosyltransferase [Bacteroidetes bacterium]|nr:glycosyltransferase [Bacteroidota bacterium]